MQKTHIAHVAGLGVLSLGLAFGLSTLLSTQVQGSTASAPVTPESCTLLYQKAYGPDGGEDVSLEERRSCNAHCKRIEIAYYNKENKTWKDESGMPAEDLAYKNSCKPFYERSPLHKAADPEVTTREELDPGKAVHIKVEPTTTLGYTLTPTVKLSISLAIQDLSESEVEEVRGLLLSDIADTTGIIPLRIDIVSLITDVLGAS